MRSARRKHRLPCGAVRAHDGVPGPPRDFGIAEQPPVPCSDRAVGHVPKPPPQPEGVSDSEGHYRSGALTAAGCPYGRSAPHSCACRPLLPVPPFAFAWRPHLLEGRAVAFVADRDPCFSESCRYSWNWLRGRGCERGNQLLHCWSFAISSGVSRDCVLAWTKRRMCRLRAVRRTVGSLSHEGLRHAA